MSDFASSSLDCEYVRLTAIHGLAFGDGWIIRANGQELKLREDQRLTLEGAAMLTVKP